MTVVRASFASRTPITSQSQVVFRLTELITSKQYSDVAARLVRGMYIAKTSTWLHYIQEALLPQTDRATRRVSRDLVNCCTAVRQRVESRGPIHKISHDNLTIILR